MSGQLAGVAHMALVRHVTCPEHGELLHAGDDETPSPPTPADGAAASFAALTEDSESSHGHDHCAVAIQRRAETMPVSRVKVAHTVTRVTEAAKERAAPAMPLGAIYRLAPKSSPPA